MLSCISGAAAVVEEPSSALHMFASERIQRPLPLTSKAFKRKPLDVSDNHTSNNNNINDRNNNNNSDGIQHHVVETDHPNGEGPAVPTNRRSRRTRALERLQAENSTLRASLAQAQSDVATERQRRDILDQLYLGIRKELGQKLEAEEIRAFNLNMQVEQQQHELRQLKRKLKDAHRRLQMNTSLSSMGYSSLYRTGHGNGSSSSSSMGSFSLSNGFSNIGGLMLHNVSSSNVMIGGQDDSDEFLINHAYSPSARSAFDINQNHQHHSFANKAPGGLNTVLEASDDDGNEEDDEDDVDSDEDMEDAEMYSDEEEDEEDEDHGMSDSDDITDTTVTSRPVSSAPTIGRSVSMQLSAVMEEEEEEEEEKEEC
ncbi:hypothetical protein BGW38_009095, partial [Lunasporangiospora selenospora]